MMAHTTTAEPFTAADNLPAENALKPSTPAPVFYVGVAENLPLGGSVGNWIVWQRPRIQKAPGSRPRNLPAEALKLA